MVEFFSSGSVPSDSLGCKYPSGLTDTAGGPYFNSSGEVMNVKRTSLWSKFLVAVCSLLILVYTVPALAAITPADRWQAANLGTPGTGVYGWNSSIAYYNGQILYVATDKKIYAYNPNTSVSTEVCDTSALGPVYAAVSGLLVTSDNHLYFHDNQSPTVNLYRIDLAAAWPVAAPAAWDTGCSGSIFALTENPWTNTVWFASADAGAGARKHVPI